MEWGFKENRVAAIVLHKCGKSDSHIFKLLKPIKNSRNFVYQAFKRYKELWGVEDRARSGRLKSVRAEAAIKTVRGRIYRNLLWKQKIVSRELNTSTQSSHASSGTIYAWECTSAQRDTSLLLLWRRSDGQQQSVSSSGMLRTGTKTSSSGPRNFFTIEEQYNNQNNNIYAQMSLEVHSDGAGMPLTFLRDGLVGDVPSGGDKSSFL